ncbi:MAG: [FeFe] hydrogenase H-cluster maturation GTPase HydF [Erysipelotrichales bacterium]
MIPSYIPNIVIIGNTNVGKSTLINAIAKEDVSIVSDISGTTTDEVKKRIEILGVGPVNLYDTAGLDDDTDLKVERIDKTNKIIEIANLIIFVSDAQDMDLNGYDSYDKEKLLIINKIDLVNEERLVELKEQYPEAIFVSSISNVSKVEQAIRKTIKVEEKSLLEGIILNHKRIVHVIPIDSAAPKGRLILPQMQLIRECLDNNIISIVLKPDELEEYLNDGVSIDLIVCDSSVFNEVSKIVNDRYLVTSYSILQANQKGDLKELVNALEIMDTLKKDAHILIMESCSHNKSHEDIAQVKIPRILRQRISNDITIDFRNGFDFPKDYEKYDLIVHCGSCMINANIMNNRIEKAAKYNIPITNFGLLFAYQSGILEQAIKIFNLDK